ncbi:MAG: HIT domain-containing protein [bacterium]
MERLWAPWRMKYILGEKSNGCIFCNGAGSDDDRKSLVLHRGEKCFVMMNQFPYNNGHVMIAPFRHEARLEDLDEDESLDLMRLLQLSVRAMGKVLNPHGFNVGINVGQVAGAGVADHVHMHVVPRWGGDTNFMPVLSETKVINEELERTYCKLIEGFRS